MNDTQLSTPTVPSETVHEGLEGVLAARTELSRVDGEAGELVLRGYRVDEIAPRATFEEMVHLFWKGRLPVRTELDDLRQRLAEHRRPSEVALTVLRHAASERRDTMDALRMAAATLGSGTSDPQAEADAAVGALPSLVGTYWRLLQGLEPVEPRTDLSHAAHYLWMLEGREPSPERVRGIDTYLNTVIDHGFNASTFTARVIVSTGSDLVSVVTGAIGALKGPLHGGAPGPALDMVFEIGQPERADQWLREKVEAGERLMGFGHRVYKVRDPRADVLAAAAERLADAGENRELYRLARAVEEAALRVLEELKPGRRLQTNVEFYTALLLHGVGLDSDLFSPTFAVGRVGGWTAHAFEQLRTGRLIRPSSLYVGETGRRWVELDDRHPESN